jgi:uncharacterized protein YjiS (DUF1127 family)
MGTISRSRRPLLPPAPLSDRTPGGWRLGRRRIGLASRAFLAFASLLLVWQKRLRDRDALRVMNTAQLMDIGITREDAQREAEKPFWHR